MTNMNRCFRCVSKALLLAFSALTAGCFTTPVDPNPFPPLAGVDVKVEGGEIIDAGRPGEDGQAGKKAPAPQKAPPAKAPAKPAPAPPQAEKRIEQKESLFNKFGPDIFVNEKTGEISKIYTVPMGMGLTVKKMLTVNVEGATPPSFLQQILGKHPVMVEELKNLHQSIIGAFKYGQPGGKVTSLTDVLVVTSTYEGLERFERAFDLLFNSIPQIDISVKIVETTFTETLDFGIKQSGTEPTIKRLLSPEKMLVQSFQSNFPNETGLGTSSQSLISEGLFTIGGIHDDWQLQAIMEVLQMQGRSDVVSKPHITVRNGGVAEISTTKKVPYLTSKVVGQTIMNAVSYTGTDKIGVIMKIRPTITGMDTIMMQLDVQVTAITGYEDMDPIRAPIIAMRTAKTDIFVQDGQSFAIGGLLITSEAERETKVPFLGDIPVVGMLFRSTYKENQKNEVVFFITPRILRQGEATSPGLFIPESILD